MLELHLRSGQVVAFDGRVVEVFADGGPSRRFHVAQVDTVEASRPPTAPARSRSRTGL